VKKILPIVFMLLAYSTLIAEDKYYDAKVQFINDSDQYIDFSLVILNSACINKDTKSRAVSAGMGAVAVISSTTNSIEDIDSCSPRNRSGVVIFGKQLVSDITDKPYYAPGQKSEIKTLTTKNGDNQVMFSFKTSDGEERGLKGSGPNSGCKIKPEDAESDEPTLYIYKDNKLVITPPVTGDCKKSISKYYQTNQKGNMSPVTPETIEVKK
jgi:hypothetical protein